MANKRLMTPIFRVSFPSVFEASSYEGGQPKFSVCAVFEPEKFNADDKEKWAALLALLDEVSMQKFQKKMSALPANFKRPIRDGEEKEELTGFGAGKKFFNISSKMKPGIVDRFNTIITDPEEIYAGCYARATVTAYGYDNVGKGLAFGLQNIQKIKDGDRLDSRVDPTSDFSDAEIDDAWIEDSGADVLA